MNLFKGLKKSYQFFCIRMLAFIRFFCFIFVVEHCFRENSYYIIITSFLKLVPEGHTRLREREGPNPRPI
jgi:hypothetical protein